MTDFPVNFLDFDKTVLNIHDLVHYVNTVFRSACEGVLVFEI